MSPIFFLYIIGLSWTQTWDFDHSLRFLTIQRFLPVSFDFMSWTVVLIWSRRKFKFSILFFFFKESFLVLFTAALLPLRVVVEKQARSQSWLTKALMYFLWAKEIPFSQQNFHQSMSFLSHHTVTSLQRHMEMLKFWSTITLVILILRVALDENVCWVTLTSNQLTWKLNCKQDFYWKYIYIFLP